MTKSFNYFFLFLLLFFIVTCDDPKPELIPDQLRLISVKSGGLDLKASSSMTVSTRNKMVELIFSEAIDITDLSEKISLSNISTNSSIIFKVNLIDEKTLQLEIDKLTPSNKYSLLLKNTLTSKAGGKFAEETIIFIAVDDVITVNTTINQIKLVGSDTAKNTGINPAILLNFSANINATTLKNSIKITTGTSSFTDFTLEAISTTEYRLKLNKNLNAYSLYKFEINNEFLIGTGYTFTPVTYYMVTSPVLLSDNDFMTLVQRQTFKYFWEFGHPVSGLARERNTSGETVTIGGSGFGLMAMIVAVERGFITRGEAMDRWETMISFLRSADRFYGVWPHWMNGSTGRVQPFSAKDNGADLVETSFMIQALITLRQYLNPNDNREANLIKRINDLWQAVQWTWFTRGGQNVLYWHWSPNFGWDMNFQIRGHNETLIAYVLAASSPTHSIDQTVYTSGYARFGAIRNGNTYYGYKLPLGTGRGGPLFFTHYSFLGLDPTKLQDQYANYWEQNKNHTLINRAYCIQNPQRYKGYGEQAWGLTASDGNGGYNAFSPDNDKGVITPTAALSSFPYTPNESMTAMKHFYYDKGDKLWGPYGFYDSYNESVNWYADSYLAIDQGPIIVMIENHRTQLLWKLFMSAPEIKTGLTKLGFTY
jgi:hypothetical protein